MKQNLSFDPNFIRQRLLNKLDKTLSCYQDLLNKLHELQLNDYSLQNSDKGNHFSDKKGEQLKFKLTRMKKYLQSLTNVLIRIDNGTYFFKKMKTDMSRQS